MALESDVRRLREEWGELQEKRTGGGLSREELDAYKGEGGRVRFARDMFDLTFTPSQLDAIRAFERGARQVNIVGGNGLGKDLLTAFEAIYEAFVLDALVLLTGPSDRQVREIMMRREVGRLLRLARGKLRYELYSMAVRIPGRDPAGILAFTASDPDRFTGHHAPRIFVGMTEAQGVAADIWQAAQRCMVGDGLFLAVGNPNQASGPLYAAARASTWETLYWSVLDHPNIVTGEVVIPGGPTREWVAEKRREYGEDSAFWYAAVLGQFPQDGGIDNLFTDAEIEGAFDRHDMGVPFEGWPLPVVALDVARSEGRDKNVAAIAKGPTVIRFEKWHSRNAVETVDRFLDIADQARQDWHTVTGVRAMRADPPVRALDLIVDAPGPGGPMVDMIRDRGRECREWWGWNDGRDSKRMANMRAEAYWTLREILRDGSAALPRDEELREELLATEYSLDSKGRVILMPKEDLRKTLGRSPDSADAAVMALAASTGLLRWKAKGFAFRLI